ncbi:fimbrial protein [Rahnella sp. ChDrAdgB13]|uniref:fimbrial protein n=1 Tax=Rahnella sp. ChDrAdgB13 TaxID=1850581 RepID=UPI0027DAC37A|nr:fimbrial protein [Rahnella sp. ChDrAdgB13]
MSTTSRVIMLLCAGALFCAEGQASDPKNQGTGQVTLNGTITETPCVIDTQSRDQSIDMGATPVSTLARDGRGEAHPFRIRLVNCRLAHLNPSLPDWRYFRATFEGPVDNGQFGLSGDAGGVALMLTDAAGNVARPGEPLLPGELTGGDQDLDYTLRLVGNRQGLRAGDFRTALRFRMDYY